MAVAKIAPQSARTSPAQTEIGGLETDDDEKAEIEAGYLWREQLWSAIRTFVASYVDARTGGRGWDACAAALDRRWGTGPNPDSPIGRYVSGSLLRASLGNANSNHFRAEWLDWFAARDAGIADLMARRVKPVKTPEQELEDLRAELREEYPKQADKIIRRARTR